MRQLWDVPGYRATSGCSDEKNNGNNCNMENAFLIHKEYMLFKKDVMNRT
jgi:hypothetical protein